MAQSYYGQATYPYMQPQQQPYYYGQTVDPNQFMYQPLVQTGYNFPQQERNALTNDEINTLKSARPTQLFNLNIEENDLLRAVCTHRDINGADVVQLCQDGVHLHCPICGATWDGTPVTEEDVRNVIDKLIDAFQNAKYSGLLPANVVREYFTMEPLLRKFGELFKYSMTNFDKLNRQKAYVQAGDGSIYQNYNSLFGPGGMPSVMIPTYTGPQYPTVGLAQPLIPSMTTPPYIGPQPQQQPLQVPPQMGMVAQPGVNPMGMGPGPNYNPQFVAQGAMVMPGYPMQPQQYPTVPQQGQVAQPQQPYTYGPAQPQGNPVPGPQPQPQQQPQQNVQKKVDLGL